MKLIFCFKRATCVWEQPFYEGFIVRQKSDVGAPELITFEGDVNFKAPNFFKFPVALCYLFLQNCVYGLNFCDLEEATYFTQQVNKRYEQEQKLS